MDDLLFLEPRATFDPCILGVARRFNAWFVVYDEAKVLAALAAEIEAGPDDDPEDLAREHFDFNVVGGWLGDATPAFLAPWSPES